MRIFGIFLFVVGFAVMVGAFFYPVTIQHDSSLALHSAIKGVRGMTEDEARPFLAEALAPQPPIANMDKMAIRAMLNLSGAATAIMGAIFAAVGEFFDPKPEAKATANG